MDYEQINKHFECMEYLHALTMTLEIVKVLSQDIYHVQYTEDYRGRLHLDRAGFDHRISFYKTDEMDDVAKMYNNFVMRNSMNNLRVAVDYYSFGNDELFDFSDIRNEIVELCNILIENYNKDNKGV